MKVKKSKEKSGKIKSEKELVYDIITNVNFLREVCGLDEIKNISREKTISKLFFSKKRLTRSLGLSRVDIVFYHKDCITLVEVKKKSKDGNSMNLLKGITQLLYYKEILMSLLDYQYSDIKLMLISDIEIQFVARFIERYGLDIKFVYWKDSHVKSYFLKKEHRYNGSQEK